MRSRFEPFRGSLLSSIALIAGLGAWAPSHASLVVVPDPVRTPRVEAVAARGTEPRNTKLSNARPASPSANEQRQTEQRCLEELMLYSLGDPHGTGASNRRLRCD